VRAATRGRVTRPPARRVSIHATRAGRDSAGGGKTYGLLMFRSTRPVRAATLFSSPSRNHHAVSIHATRAGRDIYGSAEIGRSRVSIHATRAGRDTGPLHRFVMQNEFRSTRPVRAATPKLSQSSMLVQFRSTRPVRAATCAVRCMRLLGDVSIHATRAGRDDNE